MHLFLTIQIDYIEQDAIITIKDTERETNAPWGISRLSTAKPNGTTYSYDSSAGEGTCAYIIDTGIDVSHEVGIELFYFSSQPNLFFWNVN